MDKEEHELFFAEEERKARAKIAVDDANYNVMHLIIPQTQKSQEDEEEANLDDLEQKLKEIEEKTSDNNNSNDY